jgi:DNA polymerase III subunit epsilon
MRSSADAGGCFPTGRHYPGIAHLVRAAARGIAEEFSAELPISDVPFVAIDVEATGLEPGVDRVVEIACIVFKRVDALELAAGATGEVYAGVRVQRHAWLVNPGRPIAPEAQAVHNISDEMVRDAPSFGQIAEQLLAVLGNGVALAYNAEFDKAFLTAEFAAAQLAPLHPPPALRKGVDWIDPLVWARELQQNEKSRSLSAVAERLGIEIGQAHRAADDAVAAGRVLLSMLGDTRLPSTYAAFIREQRRLARVHRDERVVWRS